MMAVDDHVALISRPYKYFMHLAKRKRVAKIE
jgi:hypothetical protein